MVSHRRNPESWSTPRGRGHVRRTTLSIMFLFMVIPGFALGESSIFTLREGDRVRGNRDAPVTLLEYSDFTCGFCEKFFQQTWPRLSSEYVDPGKVRLVYRDFPRATRGPSVDTALAARCAGDQGQYWAMHDRLFSSRDKYGAGPLERQAEQLGLNKDQFSKCFQSGRHLDAIFVDLQEGGSLGVRGTPSFILFLTHQVDDSPKLMIPGAFPYEVFKEEIDRLLERVRQ